MPRYSPTNEKLKALLTADNNRDDHEMVGRALKMSKRTVDRNVQQYLKYGKQTVGTPERPKPKMDAEMVQFLLEYLSGFPGVCKLQLSSFVKDCNTPPLQQATIAELNRQLQERFGVSKPVVCNRTIINHLNKEMVTWKVRWFWSFLHVHCALTIV